MNARNYTAFYIGCGNGADLGEIYAGGLFRNSSGREHWL